MHRTPKTLIKMVENEWTPLAVKIQNKDAFQYTQYRKYEQKGAEEISESFTSIDVRRAGAIGQRS